MQHTHAGPVKLRRRRAHPRGVPVIRSPDFELRVGERVGALGLVTEAPNAGAELDTADEVAMLIRHSKHTPHQRVLIVGQSVAN